MTPSGPHRSLWRRALALLGRPEPRPDAEPEPGRRAAAAWRVRSLFVNYRRILDQNNAALELMAEMERALGGEYIFDRTFLETSVRRVSERVHHVAYNLNALTGNAHVALYDRFQDIQSRLHQILEGTVPAGARGPVLPFSGIDWDMEPQAGLPALCLNELSLRAGVRIADGFVVVPASCLALAGREAGAEGPEPGEVRGAVAEAARALAAGGAPSLSVTLALAEDSRRAPLARRTGLTPAELDAALPEMLARALDAEPEAATAGLLAMVQEEPAAALGGEVLTRAPATSGPEGRLDLLLIRARVQGAPGDADAYALRRAHPFDAVRTEVAPRPVQGRLPGGQRPVGAGADGLLHGSALLAPKAQRALAETALLLERRLGGACEVRWNLAPSGEPVILSVAPQPPDPGTDPDADLSEAIARARVLCQGGQTVQSGIAAGTVVRVTEALAPQDFPAGAVAVAATASPRLAPLLQRAGALLTATGTAAGHLATVARELRVPAVFGMPGVLEALPEGTAVTVDAAEDTVYEGIQDELLRHAGSGAELDPGDPEYRLLRRLLRFILPLHLVDPQTPDFSPEGCRSYHDILHYCHERAVSELAELHEKRPGLGGLHTRRLATGVPFEIRVLDIGGGLGPDVTGVAEPDDVACEPLRAFLDGLRREDAWDDAPADLSLRDVMTGMGRTSQAMGASPETLTGNLAITGADYLNLSLRLGYHFSVVDALLSGDATRDYVYFRFVGGLADPRRRERRARFIRRVLAALDFNVSQKGDLVAGRLKLAGADCLRAALTALGALTAVTRQRDMAMHADSDAEALYEDFVRRHLRPEGAEQDGETRGATC